HNAWSSMQWLKGLLDEDRVRTAYKEARRRKVQAARRCKRQIGARSTSDKIAWNSNGRRR
ncbi:MAG: hypothetical protein J6B47_06070, partial [Prevotella sp.]|nr:hypothetical protein [Prevotella sp.]